MIGRVEGNTSVTDPVLELEKSYEYQGAGGYQSGVGGGSELCGCSGVVPPFESRLTREWLSKPSESDPPGGRALPAAAAGPRRLTGIDSGCSDCWAAL
eukprot:759100-Hanusia_phi.AAC.1